MASKSAKAENSYKATGDVVCLAIGIILMMFRSQRILYVRFISEVMIYGVALLLIGFYIVKNYRQFREFTGFKMFSFFMWVLILMYDRMWLNDLSVPLMFCAVVSLLGGLVILQAPLRHKEYVLKVFTWAIVCILTIAMAGWIVFLCGVDLPNYQDTSDRFYMHKIYYVFNTFAMNSPLDLYRFAGPFLEPGHLGTMCAFLLYIDNFNLKKFRNIIMLVSLLMSISLAAYGLMVGGVIIVLWQKRKYWSLVAMVAVFIGVGIGATFYNGGENSLNRGIVSRLEITEDGDIAGNNRTSRFFDLSYAKFINTDKVWMGVGKSAYGSRSDNADNVTVGTAGYKRYFYLRGYIGCAMILLFIFVYTYHYRSPRAWGFLIIYLVANMIRDYPTKEMWMYLFMLAMPVLTLWHNTPRKKKIRLKNGDATHLQRP